MLKGSTDVMNNQYYCSPVRTNLLNWYKFSKEESLLETNSIGGVLTDFFCNSLGKVVSIQQQKSISDICASNLEIIIGKYKNLIISDRFDYVAVIEDIASDEEFLINVDILHHVKQNLKEKGTLIIALNNRNGMKYWSGAAEEYSGKPYAGLIGRSDKQRIHMYSKPELEKILKEAGFVNIEFYYPVPDFVFPSAVYSDDYLPQQGDLREQSPAYQGENYGMFSEEQAYMQVCKDEMFPYFANSFLIFAGYDGR